jgi:hypothetical protein
MSWKATGVPGSLGPKSERFTQVKSPLASRHRATRARPLVVSRSGTVRQVRPPPGPRRILPAWGAGRVSTGITPRTGRRDLHTDGSTRRANPKRRGERRQLGTGGRPRLHRVPRHSSGSSASKPASSATFRRAGEAALTRNATPASLAARRARTTAARPAASTNVKQRASTTTNAGRAPRASSTHSRNDAELCWVEAAHQGDGRLSAALPGLDIEGPDVPGHRVLRQMTPLARASPCRPLS